MKEYEKGCEKITKDIQKSNLLSTILRKPQKIKELFY